VAGEGFWEGVKRFGWVRGRAQGGVQQAFGLDQAAEGQTFLLAMEGLAVRCRTEFGRGEAAIDGQPCSTVQASRLPSSHPSQ
jgi:hypothetical protein